MKKTLIVLFGSLISICSFSQEDTTNYLFKGLHYSYIQYTGGYSRLFFDNNEVRNGFTLNLIAAVVNEKMAIGLDFDGFVENVSMGAFVPYDVSKITSYVAMSINIEPLLRPKKLINFSFPVKIGYGGGTFQKSIYYPNGNVYSIVQYNDQFFALTPGIYCFVNLFKPLSLGVGGNYRYTFGGSITNPDTNYSGFSANVVLRLKWDTRAWNKKMLERQKLYFQQQQNTANPNQ